MNPYIICGKKFATFDDVVKWVWDEFKIEFMDQGRRLSEAQKRDACKQISDMLNRELGGVL